MNTYRINQNLEQTTKALRAEAGRFAQLAETLEKARALLGVSPIVAAAVRKAGNTTHRLTEPQRNQLDLWLMEGKKTAADICKALGISRARIYQRRTELKLNTYRGHRGPAVTA